MSRIDHETSTVDAAREFERRTAEDATAAEDARRESFPRPPVRVEPSSRPRLPEWDDLW